MFYKIYENGFDTQSLTQLNWLLVSNRLRLSHAVRKLFTTLQYYSIESLFVKLICIKEIGRI